MYLVGKIDKKIYKCISKDATTDEVVITDERILHIKAHHPGHFETIKPFLPLAIASPDYILEDKEANTGLILKQIEKQDIRFKAVIKLHTSADTPGFKNSILSVWIIRQKEFDRLIRNKKILYKRN